MASPIAAGAAPPGRREHGRAAVELRAQPRPRIVDAPAFTGARAEAEPVQGAKGRIHTYQAYGSCPAGVYCRAAMRYNAEDDVGG